MFKKREKKAKGISILDKKDLEDDSQNKEIIYDSNEIEGSSKSNKDNLNSSLNNFLNKKRNTMNTLQASQFSTKTTPENSQTIKMMEDLKYKSKYSLQNDSNNAFRELEVDTERDKDAMAIRVRNQSIAKDKLEGKISTDQYMGKDATISYAEKSERDISRYKMTGSLGPMRAPSNIRVTCRFDYAHGICKDYKETGYCGFGDNCVFVHDRSDYKTGWEVEEEWRREQIKKQKMLKEGKKIEDEESDEEELLDDSDTTNSIPLECPICEHDFSSPVFTKCLHYFCEKCALTHYAKSSLCYVCKKPTQGIFNNAEKIIEKVKLKKKKGKSKFNTTAKPNSGNDDALTTLNDDIALSSQVPTASRTYYDNMEYLTDQGNRKFQSSYLNLEEEEDDYGFKNYKSNKSGITSGKSKKNKFKTQNELEFISDYKSY